MTKKTWLALSPLVFVLGFGCSQNVIASPQSPTSDTPAAAPDTDSDYDGNNDFDNSQNFSQDQSADASSGSAQSQAGNPSNQNLGGSINSSDEDED